MSGLHGVGHPIPDTTRLPSASDNDRATGITEPVESARLKYRATTSRSEKDLSAIADKLTAGNGNAPRHPGADGSRKDSEPTNRSAGALMHRPA